MPNLELTILKHIVVIGLMELRKAKMHKFVLGSKIAVLQYGSILKYINFCIWSNTNNFNGKKIRISVM